jgi:hypothetical protein
MKHLITLYLLLFPWSGFAQADASSIKPMVEAKRYVMVAQSMYPQGGGMRNITSGYDLRVTPDTVICRLPYVGRAYQASINLSDAGYEFTSTEFEYSIKDGKKGSWEVAIKPKDVKYSPKVFITITSTGKVSIRISSNDRQSISYNGYIKDPNQK